MYGKMLIGPVSFFQDLVKRSMMKTFGLCEYLDTTFILVLTCNVTVLTLILDIFVPRYEKSSRFMKDGYERDFLRYLQSLLAEVERRIRRGHARLALSQAQQSAGVGADFTHCTFATFCFSLLRLRAQEFAWSFQQAAGPTGKNEEKAQVLTEKIEDLVVQVRNDERDWSFRV